MVTSLFSFHRLALSVGCLAVSVLSLKAQTLLYITDGDNSKLQAINTTTGSITFTATTSSLAYPIAVRDTIALGHRDQAGLTGRYDLADGHLIGTLSTASESPNWSQTVDGAVNGDFNYTFRAFVNSSTIYRTDANWSNAVAQFTVTGSTLVGITFDSASGNLWISDNSAIYQYTLAGSLVSQFSADGYGPLAYQAETDTLWLVPNNENSPLRQYSKTGTLLQSLTAVGRSGNVYGAEFAAIPEPSTYALLALGGGLLLLTARRRRA